MGKAEFGVIFEPHTWLTKRSAVLRSSGIWSSGSPSAVWSRRGRTPFAGAESP